MQNTDITTRQVVFNLTIGFAKTSVLFTLVKCGIINELDNGAKTLDELVEACQVDKDVLYRLLRFSISIQLIRKEDDVYRLTNAGELLAVDQPSNMASALEVVASEPWQKSWMNLIASLKNGIPAFNDAMGAPFFDYLDNHPQYNKPYNKWMTQNSATSAKTIVKAYDFSKADSVCDIGGGQGFLLLSILNAYPHLKGILFDQANTIKENVLSDFSYSVEIKSGNFFEFVPSADLLIMKSVLHDWSDEQALQILLSCKRSMASDCRLLIVEMLLGDEPDIIGCFYDLHMQVLLGGRERTRGEFISLFERAGLRLLNVYSTKSPMNILEVSL